MSDPLWWPTEATLTRKLREATTLVSLAGAVTTADTEYTTFVDSCLKGARGRVRGAVEVKHDPEVLDALDAESALWLQRIATVIAAHTAYSDGTGDLAIPQRLLDEFAQAEADLENLATGKRRIGRAANQPGPKVNQAAGVVDHDSYRTGVSVAGFKLGFR